MNVHSAAGVVDAGTPFATSRVMIAVTEREQLILSGEGLLPTVAQQQNPDVQDVLQPEDRVPAPVDPQVIIPFSITSPPWNCGPAVLITCCATTAARR